VGRSGCALFYATDELRGDIEVVMTAVSQNGKALQYAAKNLQGDEDLVLAAVRQNGMALFYAAMTLRGDKEVVMAAVEQDGEALYYAAKDLRGEIEVVLAAVRQNGWALRYAEKHLRRNKEVVMAAVQQHGVVLKFAAGDLQGDGDIAIAAVGQDADALKYVKRPAFKHTNFLCKAAKTMRETNIGKEILHKWVGKTSRKQILADLVKHDPCIAKVKNKNGINSIDLAVQECKEAMENSLRLFGQFHVKGGPMLHHSRTACVFKCTKYSNDPNKENCEKVQQSTALKCMNELDLVVAELNGRYRLNPNHVISILNVYVDSAVPDVDLQRLKMAAADPCEVLVVEELQEQLTTIILKKTTNNSREIEKFNFVLVFNFAERTLDAALKHDGIIVPPFTYAKKVALDVAEALSHLHSKGRIHADVKPLNILRDDEVWKLTDLDVSCEIGHKFGLKPPSSGYCPPEMANIMCNVSNSSDLTSYTAHISYDLWSFGVVLYNLISGQPLWHTDQDDNITSRDEASLKYWDNDILEKSLLNIPLQKAYDLIKKLLDPDPNDRCKHFLSDSSKSGNEMQCVMKDPFFTEGSALKDAMNEKSHLICISKMTTSHLIELMNMQDIFYRATNEANEVQIPTTFVILKQKLPPLPSEEERKQLIEFISNEDGSDIAIEGVMAEKIKGWMELLKEGKSWVEDVTVSRDGIPESDHDRFFDMIKKRFKQVIQKNTMYFYLVDELTGKPVRAEGYPLEITQPSEFIPRALPFIQNGMKAMSLYNGASGLFQMFGFPVPNIPKNMQENLKDSVHVLKQSKPIEAFSTVHEKTDAGDEDKETVHDACLREVVCFIKENDVNHTFAGLTPVGDHAGTTVWTKLRGEKVKEVLLERSKQRQVEEENESHAAIYSTSYLKGALKTNDLKLKSKESELLEYKLKESELIAKVSELQAEILEKDKLQCCTIS